MATIHGELPIGAFEEVTQSLAQGRDAEPDELGGLLSRHVVEVEVDDDRACLLVAIGQQRPHHLRFQPGFLPGDALTDHIVGAGVELLLAALAVAELVERPIRADPVHPGQGRALAAELIPVHDDPGEGLLDRVLGELVGAQDVARPVEDHVGVALIELGDLGLCGWHVDRVWKGGRDSVGTRSVSSA